MGITVTDFVPGQKIKVIVMEDIPDPEVYDNVGGYFPGEIQDMSMISRYPALYVTETRNTIWVLSYSLEEDPVNVFNRFELALSVNYNLPTYKVDYPEELVGFLTTIYKFRSGLKTAIGANVLLESDDG